MRDFKTRRGFSYVRWPLAAVLLLSSTLKTVEFLQHPPADRMSTILFVVGQAWLAVWLLSGFARRTAWCVALVVFVGLTCAVGREVWLGDKSCGCFGSLVVPPWVTLGFDSAAVAGLFCSWPGRSSTRANKPRLVIVAVAAVLAGVALAVYMDHRAVAARAPATTPARQAGVIRNRRQSLQLVMQSGVRGLPGGVELEGEISWEEIGASAQLLLQPGSSGGAMRIG